MSANDIIWPLFLATVISMTVFVVAFTAALVIAQRRRLRLQQDYAQRILSAQEEERAWVARELHDDLLQRVAMVRHELDSLWSAVSSHAGPQETHRLKALTAELTDLGQALRSVAHRLHPTIVDQLGLSRALESLAQEFLRSGLEVTVTAPDIAAIPPEVAHTAYRIAQEALRNIVKHAGVQQATVALEVGAASATLRITDLGQGFTPLANGRSGSGIGLASMRERVALVRGTVSVQSKPGAGTTVEATLPLGAAA